jgi:ssDNA-binding Zn-finger/Zn-ribbon topoisomerase 1
MSVYICPKCSSAMRQYTRPNGQRMLQCLDRKGCNLRMPIADAPAPDHGLEELKALPGTPADGFAGVRGPVAADGFQL